MGYTKGKFSKIIPLSTLMTSGGTWAIIKATNIWTLNKTAAADTTYVNIPITPPFQTGSELNGVKVTAVEINWTNATADVTSLSASIYKYTLPVNGTAMAAPAAATFTYDADHDAAAERVTQDEHKMLLTLSAPIYVDDDTFLEVLITIIAAAGSVVKIHEARVFFEANF